MDWGNVTVEDVMDTLREVDWSSPPRPLAPSLNSSVDSLYPGPTPSGTVASSAISTTLGFLRRPLAIVAAFSTAFSIAILNDSFAGSFSEKVTRSVRQLSPHLAAKMRPPHTTVIGGRPAAKRAIYICGRPRWMFVLIFFTVSLILWVLSCGLLTVIWAFAFGLLGTILHASFRTPNLKARLNTFREEFRAVWRNYNEL
ncbi:hypothetical protein SAY86_022236 [Trapa natans]|uniref:PRA1 family protein n=1 Tax=Trapa natans TaxID=22666 RepID=A0AAN7MB24_TRANT|nr:hypothetical protein SAY86_022236 [Trapa natans]